MNAESVLIAEDSLTQALRLQNTLEKNGFTVTTARNGREALNALTRMRPALVISDIQMPVMDGYELCRHVKADTALRDIPLILLTSLSAPQDIIRGLECGADNFVVKPYDEAFLLARIRTVQANRDLGDPVNGAAIPIHFAGERYEIAADRRQILNLLLSTYETAVKTNADLVVAQEALKAAQAQLFEAEKIQSVARLAAGVAHEVKNPLAIIEMGVEILATKPDDETMGMLIREMKESVRRANHVIAGLMDVSFADESGMQEVSIVPIIERALAALAADITRSKIVVTKDCTPSLPPCRIDVQKIEQVFANVIANALQEMPDGGRLDIRISTKVLLATDVKFEAGDRTGFRFRAGDTAVVVQVRDTGGGISPANLPKVFDPFFSTRPTGKGMGLGLTVARKFMELHGGKISLASAGQGGTEVTLLFKAV